MSQRTLIAIIAGLAVFMGLMIWNPMAQPASEGRLETFDFDKVVLRGQIDPWESCPKVEIAIEKKVEALRQSLKPTMLEEERNKIYRDITDVRRDYDNYKSCAEEAEALRKARLKRTSP